MAEIGTPTIERHALNQLLALYPMCDVLDVDWQIDPPGPWLLVTLGQRSDTGAEVWARHPFAIFKRTGAIHGINHDGSVTEDPIRA